jgi:hypothetical protein
MPSRRELLALMSMSLVPWRTARAGNLFAAPVRRLTSGPKFHWFGYYDKWQFDPGDRYVLGCEVNFEHRTPAPDDEIRIGMVDLQDQDRWIELGTSRAWNWQQGCMLQFVPGSATEVIWNDRVRDGARERFVSHVLDISTGRRRTLPEPVYALSPDGRSAVTPDFRRLNDCRPGYGYAGIPDPNERSRAPAEAGIRRMALDTGASSLIIPFDQVSRLPYEERSRPFHNDPARAKHWFNHLLYSTHGSRFLFLHRWRLFEGLTRQQAARGGFSTRMLTAQADGSDLYVVDPFGGTSHFIWRDPQHICAWAWHPSHGEKFYLFRDRSREVQVVGPEAMPRNGHNTYLPGRGGEWILNDTYPDEKREQHLYAYHVPANRRVPLGAFHSPPAYVGEWRCDLHPRSSRDGSKVVIDSTHEGLGRQMYLVNIADALAAGDA